MARRGTPNEEKLLSQIRNLRQDLQARDDRIAELELSLEEIASVISEFTIADQGDEEAEDSECDPEVEAE